MRSKPPEGISQGNNCNLSSVEFDPCNLSPKAEGSAQRGTSEVQASSGPGPQWNTLPTPNLGSEPKTSEKGERKSKVSKKRNAPSPGVIYFKVEK